VFFRGVVLEVITEKGGENVPFKAVHGAAITPGKEERGE
jgi:hypothetical protein